MTWSWQLSKNLAGKQFISHLLQIVHANYRGFKIFNVRPGILLSFGWELCPTFALEMIYDRCQLRLCTLTSWWRRAHGFKISLQKGHQEENDDPWCFRVATLVWKNSAKTVQNKATEVSLIWGSKQCTSNRQDEGSRCFIGLLSVRRSL